MVRKMFLVLSLIGIGVGCGEIDEGPFVVGDGFDRVEVKLSNGDLTIVAHDEPEVVIEADFGGLSRPGSIGRYLDDGVLIVDYDCALCGGEVLVRVPHGVPVDADLAQGDLTLDGLSGPVVANMQAGEITGIDLACDANLSTRAGEVNLSYSFRPADLLATTTLGEVNVELPAGAYDFDFGSRVGVVNLWDVSHDPGADSRIALFAEAGEINVTGLYPR